MTAPNEAGGTVVRVGLVSDTHGLFREAIVDAFRDVALIVHAGDVGRMDVLDRLSAIAPVVAVFGNVDDPFNPRLAPARTVPVGPLRLRVSHGHELGSPNPTRLAEAYGDGDVDILMFGHTHKSVVATERRGGRELLVVNPGAAGPKRFSLPASVAVLTVTCSGPEASRATARTDVRIVTLD